MNHALRVPLALRGAWLALACLAAPAPAWAAPVEPPQFSVPRGFFSAPFQVVLTSATPEASIRFTTDGSLPSAQDGTLYAGPVDIRTTTVLRAVAFTGGTLSRVVTRTYLFLQDVTHQRADPPGYPATFAATNADGPYPADYGMDPDVVEDPQYAAGMVPALQRLPSLSVVTQVGNLFDSSNGIYVNPRMGGREWERPASLEWLDPAGGEEFTIQAGVRIHGSASRSPNKTPKKSFRFYFRAEYGESKLRFPLFGGLPAALGDAGAPRSFDRIILKGGSTRAWPAWNSDSRRTADYVLDEFGRVLFREMGHLAPYGGQFVHLYLNGMYWGLYNTLERVDDLYLADHVGGAAADFDLVTMDDELTEQYAPVASAGDTVAWTELQQLVDATPVTDTVYEQAAGRVDLVNLADYIIRTHYVGNTDWPEHNWFAYRHRTGTDTRFRMLPWDDDHAMVGSYTADITAADFPGSPARLFLRLITNPRFQVLVSDRLALHTTGNGALTAARCLTRYQALLGLVDQPILAESARWGDYARDVYTWESAGGAALPTALYTRNQHWLPITAYRVNYWCPRRTGNLVAQYTARGWYLPRPARPTLSPAGGEVPVGTAVSVHNPSSSSVGSLYYTTDGTDPRGADDAPTAAARPGGDGVTVTVEKVVTLTARVQSGTDWSPPTQATFYVPQDFSGLVVNEISYHPLAAPGLASRDLEFLELHNRSRRSLQLDNVRVAGGISLVLPLGTSLEPGGFLVLASSPEEFAAFYGFPPAGGFDGNLGNGGDTLEVLDGLGRRITRVSYSDLPPWPAGADGTGATLELTDPGLDGQDPASWHASSVLGGTPGMPNSTVVVVSSSSSGPAPSSSVETSSSFSPASSAAIPSSSSSAAEVPSSSAPDRSSSSSFPEPPSSRAVSGATSQAWSGSSADSSSSGEAPPSSASPDSSSAELPTSQETASSSAAGEGSSSVPPPSSSMARSSSAPPSSAGAASTSASLAASASSAAAAPSSSASRERASSAVALDAGVGSSGGAVPGTTPSGDAVSVSASGTEQDPDTSPGKPWGCDAGGRAGPLDILVLAAWLVWLRRRLVRRPT